ncbi:Zn-ribbon-containing protein [Thaumasiovibrio subtropicus]|uniref:Zn-ribbon-containing protein n=1 Tax=Thaumasiovibrio subtropicus TaxID=1891207 RepID=UPI000B35F879|nr:Zn-ribbon-containing protein [Thaumasiovibrio subtropicus]
MYVVELQFDLFDNSTLSDVDRAINGVMDALRYNGQVLGREFPIIMGEGSFTVRAVCPETESLHPDYHSPQVTACLKQLSVAGLLSPKVKVLGRDLNSETSSETERPAWMVLYTSFVHTCSPLKCGDALQPIPLYHIPATLNGDHKAILKWQTEWQACDELQMAAGCQAEHAALHEIRDIGSDLFRRGWDLRGRIEYLTKIPTYYYQYQVGGESLAQELARSCPKCGSKTWKLDSPLHDLFQFRCDDCRIVSNLSWDFQ